MWILDPVLSIKQTRESSWSPDSPGIENSALFIRADPELGVEGGFSWLCVCAQGGARQELVSQLCQLGETPFP